MRLSLPDNEANAVLVSMISRVAQEYMTSPEHGLDKYLSVKNSPRDDLGSATTALTAQSDHTAVKRNRPVPA